MDKFAGRYGWDHNTILNLPASIFVGYYAAIKKSERKQFNEQLKAAAFTAWRFEVTIAGALGGGKNKVSFPDYLEAHNLLSEEEIRQNKALKTLKQIQNKQKVKEGMKKAADIMEWDTQRQESLRKTANKGG